MRHYTRAVAAQLRRGLGIYPLGSCTMKYNPKVNERRRAARASPTLHPLPARGARPGRAAAPVRAERVLARDRRPARGHACSRRPAPTASSPACSCRKAYHDARGHAAATRSSSPTPPTAPTRPRSTMAGFEVGGRSRATPAATSTSTTCAPRPAGELAASCSPTPTRWASSTSTSARSPTSSTTPAACSTATAPTSTPSSASPARRPGLRRRPLQPAQDLLHAARRRRPGRGPVAVTRHPGPVPAGARRRARGRGRTLRTVSTTPAADASAG